MQISRPLLRSELPLSPLSQRQYAVSIITRCTLRAPCCDQIFPCRHDLFPAARLSSLLRPTLLSTAHAPRMVLLLERAARLVRSVLFSQDGMGVHLVAMLNFATNGAWWKDLLQRAAVWIKMEGASPAQTFGADVCFPTSATVVEVRAGLKAFKCALDYNVQEVCLHTDCVLFIQGLRNPVNLVHGSFGFLSFLSLQ